MEEMKRLILIFSCLFLLFSVAPVSAQQHRGVTLNPNVSEQDISDLAKWKPNIVRYQLAFGMADTADLAAYDAWLSGAIDRLAQLLPVFSQNGIKVVIDLYSPPGGFVSQQTPALHRVFAQKEFQDAIVEVWAKIAQRFAGNPAVFGYDLLNEPAERSVAPGLSNWNDLALRISQRIRAIDAATPIIVEPIYGDQARLNRLKILPISNVIYSIHMYFPLRFQQQGLYGFPLGVKYPQGKKLNKKKLLLNLKRTIRFKKKNKVQIYVGEFSAVRWAPGNSSFKYLKDVISIFEKQKWHWTYHAFRESDPWSVEHGNDINNPNPIPGMTDRAKLLRGFFAKNR